MRLNISKDKVYTKNKFGGYCVHISVNPTSTLCIYVCHGPARYSFLILTISTNFTAHALKIARVSTLLKYKYV